MPPEPLAGAAWLTAPGSRRLLALLDDPAGPALFVGGCVRDTLLDPTADPADLDLATPLPPEEAMRRLAAEGIQVVPTGLAHGTVTAVLPERHVEITTLRRDVATDGRRAVVAFTREVADDAARRDFTVNALYCDARGHVLDPVGGLPDLARRRIRFVGDPVTRIREDYLRILRFFRFQARLGRGEPDAAALAACAAERAGLTRIAAERVRVELLKLLAAAEPLPALTGMVGCGVWAEILPGRPDLGRLARLLAYDPAAGPLVRLAALTRSRADIAEVAQRLRLSGEEARVLMRLCAAPLPAADADADAVAVRRLVDAEGDVASGLLALAAAEPGGDRAALATALALARAWRPPPFPIGGADLLARGVPAGPALGALLAALRAWWVERDFAPDRAACLAELGRRLGG
jgi:tRNA nucleotidyltransferase/poly(A) polymerase